MENFHLFWSYQHRNHVDSVLDSRSPVTGHPDQRRSAELLELIEVDRADWAAKAEVASCLYFDESDRLTPLDDEVQVSMPILEPVLQHPPAALAEPSRGDPFAEEAEGLGFGKHPRIFADLQPVPDIPILWPSSSRSADAVEVLESRQHVAGLGGVRRAEDAGDARF
jgi:hypothetical protein